MTKKQINTTDNIVIRGARVHNLKNITINIPKDKLIVISGVSGSGKSSLAFDTLFAEGQRRYIESLSSYARQFLGKLQKPEVDEILGICPAIAIEQKTTTSLTCWRFTCFPEIGEIVFPILANRSFR